MKRYLPKRWVTPSTPTTVLIVGITTALVVAIIQELEKYQLPLAERIVTVGLIGIGIAIVGAISTPTAGEFLICMSVVVVIILPTITLCWMAWPMVWQKLSEHKFAVGFLLFSVITSVLTKLWLRKTGGNDNG